MRKLGQPQFVPDLPIVHRPYITPALYYTGPILHRPYITPALYYTSHMSHQPYITLALYYTGPILHRSILNWSISHLYTFLLHLTFNLTLGKTIVISDLVVRLYFLVCIFLVKARS